MDIMTPMKSAWMVTKTGDPFAPKTLLSQVSTDDGKLLEDKLNEDFNEVSQKLSIPETTDTTLEGSYPGLLKVNEIGGKMEQFSTTGAQLFDKDNLTTGNILDDGSFGTSTSWGYQLISVAPNESYTISGSVGNSGGYFAYYDESKNVVSVIGSSDNMTVTVPDNVTCLGVSVILSTDADTLMVNAGTEPLPYEPYTGGQASPNPSYSQEIKCVKGKNLLDCRGLTEQTVTGVTFTPVYDDNGNLLYIEANGTNVTEYASNYELPNCTLLQGDYIISGCPSGGSASTFELLFYNDYRDRGSGVNATIDNDTAVTPFIIIRGGYTADHLRFYPMIRHASVADPTYVPYGLLRVKTHGKNFIETYGANAISSDYGAIATSAVANLKSGKTYTISADITASTATRAYWNNACGVFEISKHFDVSAGTNRYSYTFTSILDGMPLTKAILSKSASGDGVEITVTNLMLEEGTVATPYEPYTESSYTFSQPIDLYGTDDVQDVITAKEINGKYIHEVYNGSENWKASSSVAGRYYLVGSTSKNAGKVLCSQAKGIEGGTSAVNECYLNSNSNVNFVINTSFATVDEWKAHLASKPMEVVYEVAEETTEPLPIADQIGLNNLPTYSDVTYVEFDCDGPQPTFKGEYPTSKENSYVIQSLSDSLTVNGHSVESNVPANAKFTDTVYDDSELRAKVTSVENQIDGFLSLDSTVVVNTGKFKTGTDNRIETTVIPAGANLAVSAYYDDKIYSTDGTRLYVSDLTTSTQYNITVQGQTVQITGIAVCCDTSDRICIHVVDSQGRASCVVYDNTIVNGTQIDFATRMSDVAAICQDDDKIYLLDNDYRLYTTDSSGMGYNNIGMVAGNADSQTISWIKVFGDTLVVGKTDEMGSKACELYDLSTGNQIEIMVSEEETVTLADVCYYEGGLIGVCTENGYFYRVECGKFYNPLAPSNSEATPTFWREFSMDVDTSYGVTMYVEGDYLVIYDSQACYLFNSDGNNYYANVNMLVNVFSRDEGVYFVCQNDATVALYETKEISLAEAIMKIKA